MIKTFKVELKPSRKQRSLLVQSAGSGKPAQRIGDGHFVFRSFKLEKNAAVGYK